MLAAFHLRTRPVPKGLAATTHIYPLALYAELEWLWMIQPNLSPDVALAAVSVIPPFPVPGADEGFMFDQTRREVKTLTDDAWARLKQIRAKRDPKCLFADYLAGPGGFRNRNGWETNQ